MLPEMTGIIESHPEKPARKIDYKFLTLAGLIVAVLAYNVTERLLLDADKADMSYDRLIIPANQVSNPVPGAVYIFNHDDNVFVDSRLCSLQLFGETEAVSNVIKASNVWGTSVNATMNSVAGYVGDKIIGLAHIDNAEREWVVFKQPRPKVRAPMENDCLKEVIEVVYSPNATPFVVDAIYNFEDADGPQKYVRFADPILLDPEACDGECPERKGLVEIVKAHAVTRFKVRKGIVQIQ